MNLGSMQVDAEFFHSTYLSDIQAVTATATTKLSVLSRHRIYLTRKFSCQVTWNICKWTGCRPKNSGQQASNERRQFSLTHLSAQ